MVFYFLCDLQRHCEEKYRTTSQHKPGTPLPAHVEQDPPYILRSLSTYVLICLGHVRDFVGKRLNPNIRCPKTYVCNPFRPISLQRTCVLEPLHYSNHTSFPF